MPQGPFVGITTIVLQTNQVFISAYLLSELAKAKISLVSSDEKHNPIRAIPAVI